MPNEYERQSISLSDANKAIAEQRRLQLTRNLFRQYDELDHLVDVWIAKSSEFQLTPRLIQELHHLAMESVVRDAGKFRREPVIISTSAHAPPHAKDVPLLVDEMCAYVRTNWSEKSAVHLAAYCLWRLNWIHPFSEGNGITARALAYLVLSIRLGVKLPGKLAIPAQINENRKEYYEALEHADRAFQKGHIDVSELEAMLEKMLARQLMSVA